MKGARVNVEGLALVVPLPVSTRANRESRVRTWVVNPATQSIQLLHEPLFYGIIVLDMGHVVSLPKVHSSVCGEI